MVRVVSQNFSPPRSRHSSGETDRDLAERAMLALSTLGRKRVEIPEYESSSDSFWDSELDGDQCETLMSENGSTSNDINGNETAEKSDVQSKRKERRRERNKLSAQAYRQRRRTQNVKEQQTLMELEAENKRLHKLVETLEKKKEHTKHLLRGCSLPVSKILQPIGEVEGVAADVPDTETDLIASGGAGPVNSRSYTPHSGPISLTLPHHPHPTLTLPPPNFNNKPVCTPTTEPQQQVPVLEKNKSLNLTYPSPNQPTPTLCPTPIPNQLFFNTNVYIGATLSPSGNLTAVPAIITVPIENQNPSYLSPNLNCNLLKTVPPSTHPTSIPSQNSENETILTKPSVEPSSVFNTVWWNGNQIKATGTPVARTIVGLVSMEMYNNNSMNNSNDANGNNNCEKSINAQGPLGIQPVSFNLNLNQATGTTCQEQFQIQNPVVSVQCFLASDDQVSVQ